MKHCLKCLIHLLNRDKNEGLQYRLKLLTHLPRFCNGRFADQHLVIASAMTWRAEILPRFAAT